MPFVRISPDVVFRSFGHETVLLNLRTGQYHGLKGSGGRMLDALQDTGDLDAAARVVAQAYGEPEEAVRRDMYELCMSLRERSLIEIHDTPPQAPSSDAEGSPPDARRSPPGDPGAAEP
jgi:hypothetical protein